MLQEAYLRLRKVTNALIMKRQLLLTTLVVFFLQQSFAQEIANLVLPDPIHCSSASSLEWMQVENCTIEKRQFLYEYWQTGEYLIGLSYEHIKLDSIAGSWMIKKMHSNGQLKDVSQHGYQVLLSDSGFSAKLCNRLRGKLVFNADGSIVSGPVAATKMMCPNIQDESAFLAALQQADRFIMSGNELKLYNGETLLIEMNKVAEGSMYEPADSTNYQAFLAKTKFRIQLIHDKMGTADMSKANATMQFDMANSRLSGKGGCNNYFAEARIAFKTTNKGTIKIGKAGSTMMACPHHMELEQRLYGLLEQAEEFEVKGNTMVIKSGGEMIISMKAE